MSTPFTTEAQVSQKIQEAFGGEVLSMLDSKLDKGTYIGTASDLDDAKEDVSNKKTDIEVNKESNTFYPSIKAVYDWVVGKFLDLRLSNLPDDLDETEQDLIKDKLGVENYNGVTPTITEHTISNIYNIDPQLKTEHWNLTMIGDTDFNFTNMFDSGHSKVITITLGGDYAFTFPSWLRSLETNDYYDTIGGTWVAEIVINIKNGGANPQGYYTLQMRN